MNFVKKDYLFIILFFISLIIFAGGPNKRANKSSIVGKYLYFPFINSVRTIFQVEELKKENTLYLKKIATLNSKLINLENLLSKTIDAQENEIEEYESYIIAQVIAITGMVNKSNLVLDKGALEKINIETPVIDFKGNVVGKVVSLTAKNSVVLPISNPNFKLGVMNKRNRVQGILEVDNQNQAFMNMIKIGSDVRHGDTIITSNLSYVFPKGIAVGKVVELMESTEKSNTNLSAKIEIFADIKNLENLIILPKENKINEK